MRRSTVKRHLSRSLTLTCKFIPILCARIKSTSHTANDIQISFIFAVPCLSLSIGNYRISTSSLLAFSLSSILSLSLFMVNWIAKQRTWPISMFELWKWLNRKMTCCQQCLTYSFGNYEWNDFLRNSSSLLSGWHSLS